MTISEILNMDIVPDEAAKLAATSPLATHAMAKAIMDTCPEMVMSLLAFYLLQKGFFTNDSPEWAAHADRYCKAVEQEAAEQAHKE